MNRNRGITLIALVISIIVLLILAGISISMLSGENGLLKRAGQARDDTIIGEEREQVELAYISAAVKKLGDDVTYQDLQDELDTSVGTNKTEVTRNANSTLNVLFKDTEHNYNVDNGRVAKVDDDNTIVSSIDDAEKLKNYYISNNFTDGEVHELNTVDGKVAKYVFYGDEDEKDYVTYNGKLFKVEYENSEWKVIDVEFVMELNTFSEQQISGIDVLITPSSPENLVHSYYDGLTTFSNMYYLKNNGDLDLTRTFTSGYVTYDDNGDIDGYYDSNGILASVVEVDGPRAFSGYYYLDGSGNMTDEPFTHGYRGSNGNYYDDSGALVDVERGICCFDPGSQVLMANGTSKAIEDVRIGDMVMSLNEDTGEFIAQKVKNCITKHNSDDLVYVNLSNGTRIGMRAYHPLLTTNGWKSLRPNLAETTIEAGETVGLLKVGDTLVGYSENVTVVSVEQRPEIENYDTYNLLIEGYHNYIVNGVVVHNVSCQPF